MFCLVRRRALAAALVAGLVACGGGESSPTPTPPSTPAVPATVAISAGNQQVAAAGAPVATAPTVVVRDAQNRPVPGVTVQFSVVAGGGTLDGGTQVTDATGVASVTRWVLGNTGAQRLSATVNALPPVTFDATLQPGTEEIDLSFPGSGGELAITTDGHPYKGFKLRVPAGSISGPVSWKVRVVNLAGPPALPEGIQIAGQVLEVTSDAPRANGLLTLDIPITTPAGRAVLVALRDPVRGTMELLVPVARTATNITVVTTHLRGDLLPDRPSGTVARHANGTQPRQATAVSLGQLIPLSFVLPLFTVPPVINPATDAWPVLDNGFANLPTGFGPAIPALIALNHKVGGAPFASFVKGLAQPGFYAEAAPLASVVIAQQRMSAALAGVTSSLDNLLRQNPKLSRDIMMHQFISGNIALLKSVTAVAFTRPSQVDAGYGVAYSSSPAGLGISASTSQLLIALGFDPAKGFDAPAVKQTADGTPVTTDGILPLPSTILPFDQLTDLLVPLQQMPGLSPQARRAFNQQLAALAGLPTFPFESRVLIQDPWLPFTTEPAVIRSFGSTYRLPAFSGTVLGHLQLNGALAFQSIGSALGLGSTPAITSLPRSVATPFVISPATSVLGSLKQLAAQVLDIVWAPFEVTPDPTQLDASNGVSFDASVPLPPSDGFRIVWDWGDGKTSNNLGLTSATHTYDVAANYTVTATLRGATGSVLGADTMSVTSAASPFWRITSMVDQDELLEPGDTSPFQVLLARLLAVPNSGLIAIDNDGNGKTSIRLRVLPNAPWAPNLCCPTAQPLPGEMRQTLGERPTVTYSVGPFFSGFGTSEWTQSTGDLTTGTLRGQYVAGGTVSRLIKGAGTQVGPVDFIRIVATRNGPTMTGTITVYAWFPDETTGEVDPVTEPSSYVLSFTAQRLR